MKYRIPVLVAFFVIFIESCSSNEVAKDGKESSSIDSSEELIASDSSSEKNLGDWNCHERGKIPCHYNCMQGKTYYQDGCCRCRCSLNSAAIGSTICAKAEWNSWNSWSDCIKTQWGGLRTRERICKSEENEAPGSCAGQGSQSKQCSPITQEFRIRKNARNLTDEELHDLVQAMTKFKKDSSKKGYRNIVSWHGYPGVCPWYRNITGHQDGHCSWHIHPLFLPWHRLLIVQLELGLGHYLKNKSIGIPYWDWTEPAEDIPPLLKSPTIYDPILKKSIQNPFFKNFILRRNGSDVYTHRKIWYPGILMDKYILKGVMKALLSHDHYKFDNQLSSNPHDQIHNCFCYQPPDNDPDWCDFSLLSPNFAAWEPAFMLHHSGIDRIFTMRRILEENAGISDWTESRVIGQFMEHREGDYASVFEKSLSPFCNDSMNPESITKRKGVATLHKSFYEDKLFGYKYDNFDLGSGYSWDDLSRDYRANNLNRLIHDDDVFDTKFGKLQLPFCDVDPFPESNVCRQEC